MEEEMKYVDNDKTYVISPVVLDELKSMQSENRKIVWIFISMWVVTAIIGFLLFLRLDKLDAFSYLMRGCGC